MSTAYRVMLSVVVYVKAESEDAAEEMAYKVVQGRGGAGECDWETMDIEEEEGE